MQPGLAEEMTADGSFHVGWKFYVSALAHLSQKNFFCPGHFILLWKKLHIPALLNCIDISRHQ